MKPDMMTAEQIGDILAKAAAFDQRIVGEADIFAWMEAIGDLSYVDALAAVTRHYRESADRLMASHVREQVRAIRNDRAAQRHSDALALPSRFEPDQIRDARVRAGVAQLAHQLSLPAADADDPRQRAIARARRERRDAGRDEPPARRRRHSGQPIDITKVPGPTWSTPAAREHASVAALHAAGRDCGQPGCTRHNRPTEEQP